MVEASDKDLHKLPSAEDLAMKERYEAMMKAVAKDEEDDYDLDSDEDMDDDQVR